MALCECASMNPNQYCSHQYTYVMHYYFYSIPNFSDFEMADGIY